MDIHKAFKLSSNSLRNNSFVSEIKLSVISLFKKYSGILFIIIILLASCKTDTLYHELKSGKTKDWFEPVPYGMVYISQGHFQMGGGDQEVEGKPAITKNVSVNSFWIDETEITNDEYRQFINRVRDSVAAVLTFKADINDYKATDRDKNIIEPVQIDWGKIHAIWDDDKKEVQDALADLYYKGNERFTGNKEIDYRKIFYEYYYLDLKQAAQRSNIYNYETQSYGGGIKDRSDFIVKKVIPVYPDTLVWVRDFTYSYNEPWTLKYFSHTAFKDYPVVGISWEQANAFCHWRTAHRENFLVNNKFLPIHPYRLPTEAEWEYAARGGQINNKYPWGSYYTSTQKGCYLANFKPKRGNYVSDSEYSTKTMKVGSFDPNGYGLYDMAGNVAEWTSTAYDIAGYEMTHDMNPEFQYNANDNDPPALKRKVIRGGSWKDVSYFIQVSTRDYEYQDSAKSFIGFRCVMNAIEDNRK